MIDMNDIEYILKENIIAFRLTLKFEEDTLNIAEFFQKINLDGFKYVEHIFLKDVNTAKFKITLESEELKQNDSQDEFYAPYYRVNLENKQIQIQGIPLFGSPPALKNFDYNDVLNRINTDVDTITLNLARIYPESYNLNLNLEIMFEIESKSQVDLIKKFLNESFRKREPLNGFIEDLKGINLSLLDQEKRIELIIRIETDEEKEDVMLVVINCFEDIQLAFQKYNIKEYIDIKIREFNHLLNILFREGK